MGCCQSAPNADDEPVPSPRPVVQHRGSHLAPDSSQAAINRPSQSDVPSRRGSSGGAVPATRPNASIRPPTPLESSPAHLPQHPPPWTRSVLESERSAFFETRLTGGAETWAAIRLACDSLRKDDIMEAQSILNAAGVNCPNGKVSQGRSTKDRIKGGLFDDRGTGYEVPNWVVTDPDDIVEDSDKTMEADDFEKEEMIGDTKQDKGKGRAPDPGETVKVRLRLSNGDADLNLNIGMKQQLSVLVGQVQRYTGASRVRLSYLGNMLEDKRSLETYGYKDGHTVNAYILELAKEGGNGTKL